MDDLLAEFLSECFDNLTVLDGELVRLERDPGDRELLAGIFRIVHTIKGTCGFLDLKRLEHLTHAAENVLGRFRDGELRPTPDAVTLILATLDRIKLILVGLRDHGAEPAGDDGDLTRRLDATSRGESPQAAQPPETKMAAAAPAAQAVPSQGPIVASDLPTPSTPAADDSTARTPTTATNAAAATLR